MSIAVCPKCNCQLEVKLTFASGPKSATPSSDIGALLAEAELRDLNQWESDFIGKLRERYDQYGDRVMLTDKQREKLEKIAGGGQ
jgi:hypothetical protein